jgi:hypothetical protein
MKLSIPQVGHRLSCPVDKKTAYNKGVERDAGIAVIFFNFDLSAPALLMLVVTA